MHLSCSCNRNCTLDGLTSGVARGAFASRCWQAQLPMVLGYKVANATKGVGDPSAFFTHFLPFSQVTDSIHIIPHVSH